MNSFLDVNRRGRVLEMVLNRPDRRNALNLQMCREILAGCDSASNDPSIGAILLRASGPVFCSGMDQDPEDIDAASDPAWVELFTIGSRLRKPLVCGVQGPALGAGLGLLANSHLAVAAHGTTFGLTEIRLGGWPFLYYQAVAEAIGTRRTRELTISSKIFNTPEALAWGLVQEIVPPFEVEERAEAIAFAVANASESAMRLGLGFAAQPQSDAIALQREMLASADYAEGLDAFRNKRAPHWPSHG